MAYKLHSERLRGFDFRQKTEYGQTFAILESFSRLKTLEYFLEDFAICTVKIKESILIINLSSILNIDEEWLT